MTILHTTVDSPLGPLLLAGEPAEDAPGGLALARVCTPDQKGAVAPGPGWRRDDAALAPAAEQLRAYFAGELREFGYQAAPRGTEFQRRVWQALERIPYGSTTSYGALAASLGLRPGAARALGAAIGANPLLVVRPCHRVIGASGALTGYAAGLPRKRALLELEGALPPA